MVSNDKLKPMTFKVPKFMQLKMQELVANGHYESRAELIREAIQKSKEYNFKRGSRCIYLPTGEIVTILQIYQGIPH